MTDEDLAALEDRSSRPHRLRQPTPLEVIEKIERLRRQRLTGKQIAAEACVSPATVSRVLRPLGLNKLCALEPEPVRRYERENPGELIHLDIKKLGRIGSVGHRITGRQTGVVNRHLGIRWEFVHVCIYDASRIAFSRVMRVERKASAVAFLEAAVAYYASLGVTVERVMTDNGSCYLSRAFHQACNKLDLKHIKTKPYTPKTNVKASFEQNRNKNLRFDAGGGIVGQVREARPERTALLLPISPLAGTSFMALAGTVASFACAGPSLRRP